MTRTQFALPIGVNLSGPITNPAPDTRNFVAPSTNLVQTGRYIDPSTGDYTLGTNGHLQGFSGIATNVYLALATIYNSSAVNGLGAQFFLIRMMNAATQAKATQYVNNALSHLVTNQQIAVNSVNVTNTQNGLAILVGWTDLSSNQNNLLTIGGGVFSNQVLTT